jgi:hypothetical protein
MSYSPPPTHRTDRRAPFLFVDNGKGVRPWLWQRIADPGYRYTYELFPHGSGSKTVCYRCLDAMAELDDGHGRTTYKPAEPGERCPRCERPYGVRPEPEP